MHIKPIGINYMILRHRQLAVVALLIGMYAFAFSSTGMDRMLPVAGKHSPTLHYCPMCHRMMADGEPCCCNRALSETPILTEYCGTANPASLRATLLRDLAAPKIVEAQGAPPIPRNESYPNVLEAATSLLSPPIAPPPRAGSRRCSLATRRGPAVAEA